MRISSEFGASAVSHVAGIMSAFDLLKIAHPTKTPRVEKRKDERQNHDYSHQSSDAASKWMIRTSLDGN